MDSDDANTVHRFDDYDDRDDDDDDDDGHKDDNDDDDDNDDGNDDDNNDILYLGQLWQYRLAANNMALMLNASSVILIGNFHKMLSIVVSIIQYMLR